MEEEASAPLITNQDDVAKDKPKLTNQLVAVLCACLTTYTTGLALGYSSPALPDIRKYGILTQQQESWFGSLMPLGAIFGGPIGGVIVDKFGRKAAVMLVSVPFVVGWICITAGSNVLLLYIGRFFTGMGAGMTSSTVPVYIADSCATFGAYYYLIKHSTSSGLTWISVLSLSVYIVGYSLGLGPVPWIMMSEVFPVKARGLATAGATFTNWSCAFLITETFSSLTDAIGYSWTFWGFGIICLLGIIFVVFIVRETRGKSLEEIELEFDSKLYIPISNQTI